MVKAPVTEVDKIIGTRLRVLRKAHNVTQAGLAKKLNVSHQQVQKYEAGTNRISIATLLQIAELLDEPLLYFLEGLGGMSMSGAGALNTELDGLEEALLEHFRAIRDADKREAVLMLIQFLGSTKGGSLA